MDPSATAVERAFELAKSGTCDSISKVRQRLSAEGYSTDQITGRELVRQLNVLIKGAIVQNEKPPSPNKRG